MIGGTVIETVVLSDKVWVNCRDNNNPSECAIYVEKNDKSRCISEGDQIWWQSGFAMWTPAAMKDSPKNKSGVNYDIRIPRIGYSGAKKPEVKCS